MPLEFSDSSMMRSFGQFRIDDIEGLVDIDNKGGKKHHSGVNYLLGARYYTQDPNAPKPHRCRSLFFARLRVAERNGVPWTLDDSLILDGDCLAAAVIHSLGMPIMSVVRTPPVYFHFEVCFKPLAEGSSWSLYAELYERKGLDPDSLVLHGTSGSTPPIPVIAPTETHPEEPCCRFQPMGTSTPLLSFESALEKEA